MGPIRRGIAWLRCLVSRSRRKDEIGEELESWVAMVAEEKEAQGLSPEEASRAARLELGGMQVVRERVYDASLGAAFETLWRDLRYAVRNQLRRPGFALAVVLTVALGLGANVAIFTVVNAVLFKPTPGIANPAGLAEVTGGSGGDYVDLSFPALMHIRQHSRALSDLAAVAPARMAVTDAAGPEVVWGFLVTGNYFDVLGGAPTIGRFWAQDRSFHPNVAAEVVISHALWQQRYDGRPDVLGTVVRVNGRPMEIIGVGPVDFSGQVQSFVNELFVPLGTEASGFYSAETLDNPGANPLAGIGRLAEGAVHEQAQAELNLLAADFAREHGLDRATPIRAEPYGPLPGMVRRPGQFFFGALMAIVGLVLAIACVNVANMLLSRGADRGKEIAIRLALGAGRGRVVRQLLIETLVLFGVASVAGLFVSIWATRLLLLALPSIPVPIEFDLAPDGTVLGFTLVVTLFAGILSGLAPAFRATRPDLVPALKGVPQGGACRGVRGRRLLIAAQVAATIVLLVCSGLFARALKSAQGADLGFRQQNVQVAQLDLELSGFTPAQLRDFHLRLLESVSALPGVESASLSNKLPLASTSGMGGIQVEGVESTHEYGFTVDFLLVEGDYHETVGIPLVQGRFLNHADGPESPRVAVINQRMATRFWPDANPVGRTFWSGPVGTGMPYEVVGVVADANYHGLAEETPNFAYMPHGQHVKPDTASWGPANVLMRTTPGAVPGLGAIQTLVRELDPSVPVLSVRSLRDHVSRYWFPQRFAAWVTGVVGLLGLLLGAVGIYGVTAYAVARRRHEISIRMALGARAADVVRAVVGGGMAAPVAGAAVGLLGAAALTRLLERLLLDVSPLDPVTFGGVVGVLGVAALVANWLPARRAARLDPAAALKDGDG